MITLFWDIGRILMFLIPLFSLAPMFAQGQTVDTLISKSSLPNVAVTKAIGDSLAAIMNLKSTSLFSQITTKTITGIAETTIKASLYGTDTIKSGDVHLGKTWYADASGTYTNPSVTIGGVTARVYLGSVLILTASIVSLPVNISTLPYITHVQITADVAGVSGSARASGYIQFNAATGTTPLATIFTPTTNTIDWTTNKVYNATIQFSSAGNTLTCVTHTLISLN